MVSRTIKLLIPLFVGVIILIIGLIFMFVVFPNIIEDEIIKNVELKDDTLQWYRFQEFPFPFKFSVYLYSIKNEEDILKGLKPVIEEIGPFVYDEFRTREIIDSDMHHITYNEVWTFKYNENASAHKEDKMIKVINAPLIAVLQNLEISQLDLPSDLISKILSEMFPSTDLFINVKARDLSFDGIKMCAHEDPSALTMLMCLVVMLMNQKLLKYNDDLTMSFSLFNYKTEPDGPFKLNRGVDTVENLGLISSYRGMENTKFWKNQENENQNECDKVNGFFTHYPPLMEQYTSYKIYSSDICKSAALNYASEGEVMGVSTYKFQTNKESFSSQSEKCVCIDATKGLDGRGHCYNDGVLDMNTCMGVPVILSFPHLMWANPMYTTTITDEISPNENIHNTIIDFEPHLGQPLKGAIRLQFNVVLRPIETYTPSAKWPKALFPIVWIDDSFQLSDSLMEEMDTLLLSRLKLVDIVQWTLIAIGVVLCAVSIFLVLCCRRKK